MKTMGRILIIMLVAAPIASAMIEIVNAQSGTATAGLELRTGAESRLQGAALGVPPAGMSDREGERGAEGWDGAVKNLGIIAAAVVVITVPKKLLRRSAARIKVA